MRASAGGEDESKSSRGGHVIKRRPVTSRPFLLWLPGGEVANDFSLRQELGGKRVQSGVGANFDCQRARRPNAPGRQSVQRGESFVRLERRGGPALVETEAPPEDPAGMNRAEPPARAAQRTQDCPAIIPAEIDRTIEAFVAE